VKQAIHYHNKSVPKALFDLFPDIGFDKSKFIKCMYSPRRKKKLIEYIGPWHYQVNRRRFFENFAFSEKFDPLVAENWYAQPVSKILATEVLPTLPLFSSILKIKIKTNKKNHYMYLRLLFEVRCVNFI
jgi:hypothetical protein